jgi:hypothetical protein
VILKWGHGHGNSQGTLVVTGSPSFENKLKRIDVTGTTPFTIA